MAEKRLNSRIINKHDTAENWSKATNFVPLQGEIIIYDIDSTHSYERVKVGDGKTLVSALPFVDANKVDKVSGKGLSTNDYTTTEKNKLAGIAEGANKTVVDSALSTTSTNPVQNKVVNTEISNLKSLIGDEKVSEQINTAISGITHPVTSVNNKTGDVTLNASDVGARANTWTPTASDVGAVPTTRTVNGKALSSNITLSASDVGAAASSHGTHVTFGTDTPKTAGTAAVGTATTVSRSDHVHPAQTSITGNAATATKATQDASGNIITTTYATKTELSAVSSLVGDKKVSEQINAAIENKSDVGHTHSTYVNQNAFSNVKVDSTTIAADSTTDTLTLVAGSNITITPDATNDKITIAATDTVYTHPSYTARTGVPTANQTPAFGGTFTVSQPVSDATGHITAVNSRTITIPNTAATTSAAGLMSASDKTKLDGIATGANKTTVDSALSSTSKNPVQNKVVNTAINNLNNLVGDTKVSEQITNALDEAIFYRSVPTQMSTSTSWTKVAYGNGKFVAIAKNTNIAAYSTDGINWTSTTLPSSQAWTDVTYGGGVYVAVAEFTGSFAYSTDGITWRSGSMPSESAWTSVAYGMNRFIAVAAGSTTCAVSYDGSSWSTDTLPISREWSDIVYDGSCFVISAKNSWAEVSGFDYNWNTASHMMDSINVVDSASDNNGVTILVCENNSGCGGYFLNGYYDKRITVPAKAWNGITYGNSKFVMVAGNTDYAAYSRNGTQWTEVKLPAVANWKSVTYGNGMFVAIADGSNTVAISYDGITWANSRKRFLDNDGNDITSSMINVIGNPPKITTITLSPVEWISDGDLWYHPIIIDGVTDNNKIDLQPTAAQILELQNADIMLMVENDDGKTAVYAIGGVPNGYLTIQALITEVVRV